MTQYRTPDAFRNSSTRSRKLFRSTSTAFQYVEDFIASRIIPIPAACYSRIVAIDLMALIGVRFLRFSARKVAGLPNARYSKYFDEIFAIVAAPSSICQGRILCASEYDGRNSADPLRSASGPAVFPA